MNFGSACRRPVHRRLPARPRQPRPSGRRGTTDRRYGRHLDRLVVAGVRDVGRVPDGDRRGPARVRRFSRWRPRQRRHRGAVRVARRTGADSRSSFRRRSETEGVTSMTAVDRNLTTSPATPDAGWPVVTTESAKLFARANAVSPGGVQGEGRSASPYPLFMTRAQGSRIWDVDGNEYIDFHASFGADPARPQRPAGPGGGPTGRWTSTASRSRRPTRSRSSSPSGWWR